MAFDLPSQPLEAALQAHGASSGAQILYETSLTSGRRSAAVRGVFTPEEALQLLLVGTGLAPRRISRDAFTVTPAPGREPAGPSEPDAAAQAPAPPFTDRDRLLGLAQARILEVLCGATEARPGDYRLAVQLWFDPSGAIEQVALLGTTGSARRDAVLRDVLRRVALGEALPAKVRQPITIIIVPRRPEETGDCAPFELPRVDPAPLLSPDPSTRRPPGRSPP